MALRGCAGVGCVARRLLVCKLRVAFGFHAQLARRCLRRPVRRSVDQPVAWGTAPKALRTLGGAGLSVTPRLWAKSALGGEDCNASAARHSVSSRGTTVDGECLRRLEQHHHVSPARARRFGSWPSAGQSAREARRLASTSRTLPPSLGLLCSCSPSLARNRDQKCRATAEDCPTLVSCGSVSMDSI